MRFSKLPLLTAVFSYFGRCSASTRRRWGGALGWLAARLLRSRAHIVRTNLALCFPDQPLSQRETWLHQHFYLLAQSLIDRGLLWFGAPADIREAIDITGLEHLQQMLDAKRPILILAPHFVSLDAAATRITMYLKRTATLYTPQSDPDVEELTRRGRARFNDIYLVSRHDGVRGMLRHLRNGIPIYYLPDMDFGRKGVVFAPFFGVPAATLLATAQIAQAWKASVVPVVSRLNADTGRYQVEILPPMADFPGEQSAEEATARLNLEIEAWVRRDPPQYYWVHRRFKTRPIGEKKIY